MSHVIKISELSDKLHIPFTDTFDCLITTPIGEELPNETPTLRWVKDDKVVDLHINYIDKWGDKEEIMRTDEFCLYHGLELSMDNGGFVLSKRLSRIFRPHRYMTRTHVNILHSHEADEDLWDGSGWVSRKFVEEHFPELLQYGRFEVTVMHEHGQEKGHVVMVDIPEMLSDFIFAAGATKTEVKLKAMPLVILEPVKAKTHMRLDIQSLINLYPFFEPSQLSGWLGREAAMFIDAIHTGELEEVMNLIEGIEEQKDLDNLEKWPIGEFIAGGGKLTWFPGTIRGMGKQHLQRLGKLHKFRWPVPGGRFYIMPAGVAGADERIGRGQVCLDKKRATAWVNSEDWLDFIVPVLGGCDGDDGVWCFPFTQDGSNAKRILVWRSPNQPGEYVVLEPTSDSYNCDDWTWPVMDTIRLFPRIDSEEPNATAVYGQLQPMDIPVHKKYSIQAMNDTADALLKNDGVLGSFCNIMMVRKAIYGDTFPWMPARLEDVIDGSVKNLMDLQPVMEWCCKAAVMLVERGDVPELLLRRVAGLVSRAVKQGIISKAKIKQLEKDGIIVLTWDPMFGVFVECTPKLSSDSWIDELVDVRERHIEAYNINLTMMAVNARPPVTLLECVDMEEFKEEAKEIRSDYAAAIAMANMTGDEPNFEMVALNTLKALVYKEKAGDILAAAEFMAFTESRTMSDSVVWQKGVAHMFIKKLQEWGFLGDPSITKHEKKGYLFWDKEVIDVNETAVFAKVNGVWFNWLRRGGNRPELLSMGQATQVERDMAKAQVVTMMNGFMGNTLVCENNLENRKVLYTLHGNLLGFVDKRDEHKLKDGQSLTVKWGWAHDGNMVLVLG